MYKRILKKLGLSETDSVSKDMIIDFLVSEGALELRKAPQDSQDLFQGDNYAIGRSTSEEKDVGGDISTFFDDVQRPLGLSHAQY